MDTKVIQTLITIATQAGIQELEVITNDATVRITCYPSHTLPNQDVPADTVAVCTDHTDVAPTVNDTPSDRIINTINSPMLGTLYHKADPDAEAFVKVGQAVKKGDILCIVEAMKIMHEVKADTDGVITEILVDDGAMVEYDQPLFGFQS